MLEIVVPEGEFFDSKTNTFMPVKRTTLQLEHSLLAISKWESRHCKPFLPLVGGEKSGDRLTPDEFFNYIKDMTITKNVDPRVYFNLDSELQSQIARYIQAPMTATTFSNTTPDYSRQIITSEIIYWQMIYLNIPFECQKWHLNRLMTLIRVCTIKQGKPEKMPYKDMVAQRRALNASRKAGHHRK